MSTWPDADGKVGSLSFPFRNMDIKANEPLARFTSARIGGPADWLATANDIGTLVKLVTAAQNQGMPFRILGSGSNVLVSDAGVRGLVIINRTRFVAMDNEGRVYAESGANLSSLARSCISKGLGG